MTVAMLKEALGSCIMIFFFFVCVKVVVYVLVHICEYLCNFFPSVCPFVQDAVIFLVVKSENYPRDVPLICGYGMSM